MLNKISQFILCDGKLCMAALVIADINPYYFTHIIQALEKRKHVLVEKPVVTNYYHLDQIENKAKDKG